MTFNEIFQLFQPQITKGHRSLYLLQLNKHKNSEGVFYETMEVLVTNVTKLEKLVDLYDLADANGKEDYHLPYPRFVLKPKKESI